MAPGERQGSNMQWASLSRQAFIMQWHSFGGRSPLRNGISSEAGSMMQQHRSSVCARGLTQQLRGRRATSWARFCSWASCSRCPPRLAWRRSRSTCRWAPALQPVRCLANMYDHEPTLFAASIFALPATPGIALLVLDLPVRPCRRPVCVLGWPGLLEFALCDPDTDARLRAAACS